MIISTVKGTIRPPRSAPFWVIVDPRLSQDGSLDALRAAFTTCAVPSPVWRATSPDETAAQLASSAVAARAARVIVVGDQALIRAGASALAGTGIPLGIVPVASAYGLARSIGVPTDPRDAIAVALRGSRSTADLMRVTIDSGPPTTSFVTVGIEDGDAAGPDGRRGASSRSPLRIGPAPRSSFGATATVGQQQPTYIRSAACVIGMGSRVVSGAGSPAAERLLHLSMLPGSRKFGVRRGGDSRSPAGRRIVTPDEGPAGHRVLLVLDEVKPYYLDGALAGQATTVTAELQPDALSVLVPA